MTPQQKYKNSEKGKKTRKEWERKNKSRLKEISEKCRKSEKSKKIKKNWKNKNRDKIRKWKREWASSENGKKSRRIWYKKHPSSMYELYKKSALKRNITFDIEKDKFIDLITKQCTYCGKLPPEDSKRNGLDRVDNSMGYIVDNLVPCCFDCNQMKGKRTIEEFMKHVEKIVSHKKEQ